MSLALEVVLIIKRLIDQRLNDPKVVNSIKSSPCGFKPSGTESDSLSENALDHNRLSNALDHNRLSSMSW